jgi:hypothetical protein
MAARRFVESCEVVPRSRGRLISPWHRGGTTLVARNRRCFPAGLDASGVGSALMEPIERRFFKGLPLKAPLAWHSRALAAGERLYDPEARKKRAAVTSPARQISLIPHWGDGSRTEPDADSARESLGARAVRPLRVCSMRIETESPHQTARRRGHDAAKREVPT